METERLDIRLPVDTDGPEFEKLLCDPDFMEYAMNGAFRTAEEARVEFGRMLLAADRLPFAEQPVREKGHPEIIGYVGAATFQFEDDGAVEDRLEFNCRLVKPARCKRYSTEAARALLKKAEETFEGEMLARVRSDNDKAQTAVKAQIWILEAKAIHRACGNDFRQAGHLPHLPATHSVTTFLGESGKWQRLQPTALRNFTETQCSRDDLNFSSSRLSTAHREQPSARGLQVGPHMGSELPVFSARTNLERSPDPLPTR